MNIGNNWLLPNVILCLIKQHFVFFTNYIIAISTIAAMDNIIIIAKVSVFSFLLMINLIPLLSSWKMFPDNIKISIELKYPAKQLVARPCRYLPDYVIQAGGRGNKKALLRRYLHKPSLAVRLSFLKLNY